VGGYCPLLYDGAGSGGGVLGVIWAFLRKPAYVDVHQLHTWSLMKVSGQVSARTAAVNAGQEAAAALLLRLENQCK
jgi:hypothetical protein